jgi:hypothetical protein
MKTEGGFVRKMEELMTAATIKNYPQPKLVLRCKENKDGTMNGFLELDGQLVSGRGMSVQNGTCEDIRALASRGEKQYGIIPEIHASCMKCFPEFAPSLPEDD